MAENTQAPDTEPKRIGIILYDDFETLDVFGPVQMWGRLPDYELVLVSQAGGTVRSAQGLTSLATASFETAPQFEILMVPGGQGSRVQVNNAAMLDFLRRQSAGTEWTTSVCTGSSLLARAGILDGRRATTNKVAFAWVAGQSTRVDWQKTARWVLDGKFMTSSGVSAGTDMALGLVEKLYGHAMADSVARAAEYCWNDNPADDPFADNE
ncbi:DJ-1/PfpI family protein [Sphingomonadaceae bacterium OTU29LAMAA1]|nr:DJ-1/PfpI family protein [Sphingomonadaceae bacterium OTU29LAMAA1]